MNRSLGRECGSAACVHARGLLLALALALAGGAMPSLAAPEELVRPREPHPTIVSSRVPPPVGIAAGRARRARERGDAVAAAPAASSPALRYVMESGAIAFGDVVPDQDVDLPGAIVVRVFSDRDWRLRLLPGEPLRAAGGGRTVPLSRLAWRAAGTGSHAPFQEGAPVVVASGPRTAGAGALVAIDLRLRIGDEDPLGAYGTSFQLELTPR